MKNKSIVKKHLTLFLLLFISLSSYSQVSFEQGYYIDNSGQKIDCLIKNIDWFKNPTTFKYKLTNDSETQVGTLKSVKEFGIGSNLKYIKSTVDIDRSNKNSYDRDPTLKKETLFLQLLIKGEATLYQYDGASSRRYFYNKKGTPLEQLIYKTYKTPEGKIAKNIKFRNQLWNDLKCSTFTIEKLQKLDYNKKDLIAFFTEYNQCGNEPYKTYEIKQKTDFNLSLRPGFNNSSLDVDSSIIDSRDVLFENETSFRFGIEAEIILGFNNGKWALLFEPTYQQFKSESGLVRQPLQFLDREVSINYRSIELPVGARHYFFLNKKSKLFVNGLFITDIHINSQSEGAARFRFRSGINFGYGLGYKYNNKYSIEVRQQTSRDFLEADPLFNSNYRTFSVIIGYTIF